MDRTNRGQRDAVVVAVPVSPHVTPDRPRWRQAHMRTVRVVEIAELLGVTKQRAHQIAEEKSFPLRLPRTPADEFGAGTRWRRGRSAGEARSLALGQELKRPTCDPTDMRTARPRRRQQRAHGPIVRGSARRHHVARLLSRSCGRPQQVQCAPSAQPVHAGSATPHGPYWRRATSGRPSLGRSLVLLSA